LPNKFLLLQGWIWWQIKLKSHLTIEEGKKFSSKSHLALPWNLRGRKLIWVSILNHKKIDNNTRIRLKSLWKSQNNAFQKLIYSTLLINSPYIFHVSSLCHIKTFYVHRKIWNIQQVLLVKNLQLPKEQLKAKKKAILKTFTLQFMLLYSDSNETSLRTFPFFISFIFFLLLEAHKRVKFMLLICHIMIHGWKSHTRFNFIWWWQWWWWR